MERSRLPNLWLIGIVIVSGVLADDNFEKPSSNLADLSLEELMNVEVTSVSAKAERKGEASAAVFVITQEDIRRSGATTVPDLLRTVPGLHVARLDANKWSVSSRGFGGRFANKMQVLVDGRSTYTPLFSGVYWDAFDIVLEDIERIEIIRGSGSSVWGANAVNGVINIITKSARDTHGGLVSAGVGTEERGFGTLRYGGQIGDDVHYRVFTKYADRDKGGFDARDDATDDWKIGNMGIRVDADVTPNDELTLIGTVFQSDTNFTFVLPAVVAPFAFNKPSGEEYLGGHALAKWTHAFSEHSELDLRLYYERFQSNSTIFEQARDTFDLDLQHRVALGDHRELVWGTGFRYTFDAIDGTPFITLDPEDRRYRIFSGFLQHEWRFFEDQLRVVLGAKLEYHDLSGLEIQPTARLTWMINENHTLWAAVTRAVRTPSRGEVDGRVAAMGVPGGIIKLVGNEDFESEKLLALEAGYRARLNESVTLDVAAFYNSYDDLRTIEVRAPRLGGWPGNYTVPAGAANNQEGVTYGFEVAFDWRPLPSWNVRAAYSFLEMDLTEHFKTFDPISGGVEDESPEQQFSLLNRLNLGRHVELDVIARYVDALPSLGIDDYLTADVRLAWIPRDNLEIAVVGQNLFDGEHPEYTSNYVNTIPTEVERGVYGKVTWRF
jgi:iron complex outermembrane receptor protein